MEEEDDAILEVGIVEERPDYQHVPRGSQEDSLHVTQAPVNSWPFRKTFKPGW
jgi:hypothetical protein